MFTLATGLHKILEKKRRGELQVNGTHLREVMQQNGFADGITGPITFERTVPDRETSLMDYIIFNFQKDGFIRRGSITTSNTSSFKNCVTPDECTALIFRGLYSNLTSNLTRRLLQLYSRLHSVLF